MSTKLTEAEKRAQPTVYIENPSTGKMVKRDGATGKQIIKAQESGKTGVMFSEADRIRMVIEALQKQCGLKDEDIAAALKPLTLPRGTLTPAWGGSPLKSKSPSDKPKRPLNAYQFFVKAVQVPKGENRMTTAATLWETMSEDEKKPYELMAQEAKDAAKVAVVNEEDDIDVDVIDE